MFRGNKNKKLVYRRFLISYILILVLPITLGSFVYYKALDIIEKDARDARMFMLKQSCTFVDNYFKDVERVVISLSLDPKLQDIMYMDPPDYGASDIYNVNEAQRSLGTYRFSTSFSSSFYVLLKQGDIAFDLNSMQKMVHFGIRNFYDNYVQYGDLTFEKWYDEILNRYHDKNIFPAQDMRAKYENGPPFNNIIYVQSFPIGPNIKTQGAIEVLINTDGINKLLSDVDESRSGWTYIVDENGLVITGVTNGKKGFPSVNIDKSKHEESQYQKINGTNMMVMSMKSTYKNWTYVTILPVNTIMAKANYIKMIIVFIVGISLVAGLAISLILAGKNVKPITEIILTLRTFFKGEIEKGRNEYDFLKNGISRLINANEDMKVTVDNQALLLKSSFLGRLIKGEFSDEKEIDMQRKHLEVRLQGQWFAAAIVNLQGQNELKNKEQLIEQDIYRLILDRALSSHIEKEGYTYILNTTQVVAVMSFDNKDRADCMERIRNLTEAIRNEIIESYSIYVDFYVGSPHDRLIDINLSYNEATSLFDHFGVENKDRHVIYFWEEKLENTGYYYPLEMEQKLINMASSGNKGETMRVLDSVYCENFENRKLSNYLEYHLLFDMRGTVLKTLERVKVDLDVKEFINSKFSGVQPKEIFDTIRKTYITICDLAKNKKKSHNNDLIEKLLAYIKSNYYSTEISVSLVASEFSISESYLSQFFKEQTGEAFSDHIEKLRISHACELLKAQRLSVEDIARLVGYNSAYSFRRAFKRVTGVLPSEYKA